MSQSLIDGLNQFYAAQVATPRTRATGNRPWSRGQKSVALAVHPSQVREAVEDAQKKGVPTDFTPDGRPVFRDRDHRKRYHQAYGFFDRDAGYGDAAPRLHKGDKAPPSRLRELAKRLAHRIRLRRESRIG